MDEDMVLWCWRLGMGIAMDCVPIWIEMGGLVYSYPWESGMPMSKSADSNTIKRFKTPRPDPPSTTALPR